MPAARLVVVGAIWLALASGLYLLVAPYLQGELAKVVAVWLALALAWWPVRPLYRRWNV